MTPPSFDELKEALDALALIIVRLRKPRLSSLAGVGMSWLLSDLERRGLIEKRRGLFLTESGLVRVNELLGEF